MRFLAKPQKKQSEVGSSGISSAGYLKYWLANFILYHSASFGSNVLSSYPSRCIFFKSFDGGVMLGIWISQYVRQAGNNNPYQVALGICVIGFLLYQVYIHRYFTKHYQTN